MNERRSEQRLMCADLVKIRVGAGGVRKTIANLEDISPSGASLQLETAVRRGASIEIQCSKCRLRGKVRYCRIETGYSVGVQFDHPGSWARNRFEPKHLLDPSMLLKRPLSA